MALVAMEKPVSLSSEDMRCACMTALHMVLTLSGPSFRMDVASECIVALLHREQGRETNVLRACLLARLDENALV